ncbi:hypothetical protein L4D20_04730 [Vibrio kyushuensis]|uniref:ABC transporter substrate-binding protein n=1 Tax=Vibrio kyushuensis TaxID=2910249 RepID=UPI003D13DBF4
MKFLVFVLSLISFSVSSSSVLVIESYHSEYDWDKSYIQGLESSLSSDVELATFQMDTKRIPENEYEKMADEAYQYYQKVRPSIVVLGDDNALRYMYPKLYDEPISIVFLGVNSNPRSLLNKYQGAASVTGVLEQPLFVKTMADIGSMIADDKRKIRIMFDSGITSQIAIDYMKTQTQSISNNLNIEIELLALETLEQWHHSVENSAREEVSAIVVGLYHTIVDKQGSSVLADEVLRWTNQHSTVPLFGFWDFSIGGGKAAGGVVLFGELQGQQAGELVMRILGGELASMIPIQIGRKGRAVYHPAEMKRWGLTPPIHWNPM